MSINLVNSVAESIKLKIKSGEYKANEKLPNEQEFSKMMGVSRTTIREAIKVLVSKNIVTIERGLGTYVNSFPGITEDPFGLEFLPEDRVIKDLRELRYFMEPFVARIAAKNAEKSQIKEMQEIIDKMGQAAEASRNRKTYMEAYKRFWNYEMMFHGYIYEMSGNILLIRLKPAIIKSVHMYYFKLINVDDYDLNSAYSGHLAVFEAIKRHDADAAYENMIKHMPLP